MMNTHHILLVHSAKDLASSTLLDVSEHLKKQTT